MIPTLTFTAAKKLINTGNEQTAQALTLNLTELYIGNGCYMQADDAAKYLKPGQYAAGKNSLFVHLTMEGLKAILRKGRFYISSEDDE